MSLLIEAIKNENKYVLLNFLKENDYFEKEEELKNSFYETLLLAFLFEEKTEELNFLVKTNLVNFSLNNFYVLRNLYLRLSFESFLKLVPYIDCITREWVENFIVLKEEKKQVLTKIKLDNF